MLSSESTDERALTAPCDVRLVATAASTGGNCDLAQELISPSSPVTRMSLLLPDRTAQVTTPVEKTRVAQSVRMPARGAERVEGVAQVLGQETDDD